MSIDFSTLKGLTIPEGAVKKIADESGRVLWEAYVDPGFILGSSLDNNVSWKSICYSPDHGMFVAIASNSTYGAYSMDGITWSKCTLPGSRNWQSVCYGGGKFVALAMDTQFSAYSTDGINWNNMSLPGSYLYGPICYGGGKFVAIVYQSNIGAYSTDGINWKSFVLPGSRNWQSVCYGGGKFVAVFYDYSSGSTTNANYLAGSYSTDGINWTDMTIYGPPHYNSVCYGDGMFVTKRFATSEIAYTYNDNPDWSYFTYSFPNKYDTSRLICYGNGKFVILGDSTYSYGKLFSLASRDVPQNNTWTSVCYGCGKFVAIASNGATMYWEQNKANWHNHLTFTSPAGLSIEVKSPGWDGTMEYSTNANTWNTWDGSIVSGKNIYIRGSGNTKVTGADDDSHKFTLSGSNIICEGNIETLLDYATVANGNHPIMDYNCYAHMFNGCTNLIAAPALPAIELQGYCYYNMFSGCSSLTTAPALPATKFVDGCYWSMFSYCTSLIAAPTLPASTTSDNYGTSAYSCMFWGCHNLIAIPALPSTVFPGGCYSSMFKFCKKIKLSTIQTGTYTQEYRIPKSGNGNVAPNAYSPTENMFYGTGGTFTGTPNINTTYYLDSSCVIV